MISFLFCITLIFHIFVRILIRMNGAIKEEKMLKSVYTADHEEPDCMRCDHICDSYEFCGKNCGPEHFWNRYERTVITTVSEEDKRHALMLLSRAQDDRGA